MVRIKRKNVCTSVEVQLPRGAIQRWYTFVPVGLDFNWLQLLYTVVHTVHLMYFCYYEVVFRGFVALYPEKNLSFPKYSYRVLFITFLKYVV